MVRIVLIVDAFLNDFDSVDEVFFYCLKRTQVFFEDFCDILNSQRLVGYFPEKICKSNHVNYLSFELRECIDLLLSFTHFKNSEQFLKHFLEPDVVIIFWKDLV